MMLAPKDFDTVNRDLEIRDLYNMEDAFHLGDSYLGAYRARLNANLAFWDGLDSTTDWPLDENGNHPLTDLILADFLVVDVTQPYAEHGSYLEIELAARRGWPGTLPLDATRPWDQPPNLPLKVAARPGVTYVPPATPEDPFRHLACPDEPDRDSAWPPALSYVGIAGLGVRAACSMTERNAAPQSWRGRSEAARAASSQAYSRWMSMIRPAIQTAGWKK